MNNKFLKDILSILKQEMDRPFRDVYVLSKSQTDTINWRIYLQKEVSSILMGNSFITIQNLFKKLLYSHFFPDPQPDQDMFLYRFILKQLIEEYIPKKNKPGFMQELLHVLRVLEFYPEKKDNICSELQPEFSSCIKDISAKLNERMFQNDLQPEGIWINDKLNGTYLDDISSNRKDQNEDHILWFYLFPLKTEDFLKLKFIDRLLKPNWHVFGHSNNSFLKEKTKESLLGNFLNYLFNQSRVFFRGESIFSKNKGFLSVNIPDWNIQNTEFFDHKKKEFEYKIWMASSIYAQATLSAMTAKKLAENGINLTDIHILYFDPKQLGVLIQSFQNISLPMENIPKYNKKSIIGVILHFLEIIYPQENNSIINMDLLFYFLTYPWINLKYFLKKRVAGNYGNPFHWQKSFREVFFFNNIDIKELEKILKNKIDIHSSRKNSFAYFSKVIESLISIRKKMEKGDLKQAIRIFYSSVKELFFDHLTKMDELKEAEFKEAVSVLNKIHLLTHHKNLSMDKKSYFHFLHSELSRIHDATIPKAIRSFYGKQEMNNRDLKGVMIRHISEGIHFPCKYLIVVGMDHSYFEFLNENVFFKKGLIPHEYRLYPDSEEQKNQFWQSCELIKKGLLFIFSNKEYTSVSHFIRNSTLQNQFLSSKKNMESILKGIPIFHHLQGEPYFWNDSTRANFKFPPFYREDTDKNMLDVLKKDIKHSTHILQKKYRDKSINEFSGALDQKNGLIHPSIKEHQFSASSFNDLAQCPQLYWFKNVLKLDDPAYLQQNKENIYEIDHLGKGNLFHLAASYFINGIIQKMPNKTYKEIANMSSDQDMNSFLNHSLKNAFSEASKKLFLTESNYIHFETAKLFYEDQLIKSKNIFIHYFTSFFKRASNGEHPLSDYIPLLTEFKFQGLELQGFSFKGKIDRIDYKPSENILLILDYKTGNSSQKKELKEICSIQNIQLLVYMKSAATNENILSKIKETPHKIAGIHSYAGATQYSKEIIEPFNNGIPAYDLSQVVSENFIDYLKDDFNIIKEILKKNIMFAVPHKEKNKPEKKDIPPCQYCSYKEICDKQPYSAFQRKSLGKNNTFSKYYKEIYSSLV